MIDEKLKIEVTISEKDCIRFGYHAFWNRRGAVRNIIVLSFILLLIIQSAREILADANSYTYIYLLIILLVTSPISIYAAHKGYYKRNFSTDPKQTYTVDKNNIRVKCKKGTEKKNLDSLRKITQNNIAIYIWWKNDFNTTIIPKRHINAKEEEILLSLVKKQ